MAVFLTGGGILPLFPKPSSTTPGDIIEWDDKEWLVCHYDSTNNRVYLIASDTVDNTIFGSNTTYVGSALAAKCVTYQNESMSSAALNMIVDTTVNGVTAKVFVPSKEQMYAENYPAQGFSWFNSNDHRKVAGAVGYNNDYWTSSASSSVLAWFVHTDGFLSGLGSPSKSHGFRPCVCVQM